MIGIQHICRLMGTYQSICEGQFFSVIMSNFCNGFGYSWNIFYSPLTAYAPLIFKIFNLSFTNCIKIFMAVVVYLSGLAMYKFTKKVTKNDNIATIAAILYILAPYRVTDMYVRNALAELTSFIFIPIVFKGLYSLLNEEKLTFSMALGTIGLILTHTIITMYTAILCFIYLMLNVKKLRNKKVLKNIIINLIFIVIIGSFFWVPLLEHKMATTYEVFVPGRMERPTNLKNLKVYPIELIYTPKIQTHIYQIGIVNLIGIVLIGYVYDKIPKEYRKITLIFLIMGIILTIMTLRFFPFEKLPAILKMIQFTFRLFEFTSFFFAFVAAVNIGTVLKKVKVYDVVFLLSISILLLVPYKSKIEYKAHDETELWPATEVTSDTGRIHAGLASFEYLPSNAFKNKDYIITRTQEPIIVSGNTTIEEYSKNGTNMQMKINNITEDTKIELPYIYYLGYEITYTNLNDNTKENIKYTESEKGFIQIEVNQASENICINVKYTGIMGMKITVIVSALGLLVMLFIAIRQKYLLYSEKYSKI